MQHPGEEVAQVLARLRLRAAALAQQLDAAIEEGAARELSGSTLRGTASFTDGSSQTKAYVIAVPYLDDLTTYTATEVVEA